MGKRSLGREPELFPWEKHRHRSSAPPKAVPRCCSSASRKQAVNKRASKCSLRGKGLLGGGGGRGGMNSPAGKTRLCGELHL